MGNALFRASIVCVLTGTPSRPRKSGRSGRTIVGRYSSCLAPVPRVCRTIRFARRDASHWPATVRAYAAGWSECSPRPGHRLPVAHCRADKTARSRPGLRRHCRGWKSPPASLHQCRRRVQPPASARRWRGCRNRSRNPARFRRPAGCYRASAGKGAWWDGCRCRMRGRGRARC